MCFPALIPAAAAAGSSAAAAGTAAAAGAAAASTAAAATAATATAATAASTAAAGMSAMQMISLAASVAGAAMSAKSAYDQGKTAEQVARNNAKTAEYAAQDALRRGEKDAIDIQRRGAALKSSQRVAMAAKGLDLGYGTADDIQAQTDFFTQSDVSTARTNAANEAWSRRAQKANFEAEALSGQPGMQAAGSLLGSAGNVASKWYAYNKG